MNIQTRIEDHAAIFANCRNGKLSAVNNEEWIRSFEGCKEGTHFGIQLCIEMLRSHDASDFYINYDESGVPPGIFADWLMEKMKGQG